VKCAYRGDRVREIEEKWIDEKKREELENKLRELKKELRERMRKRIDDLKKEEEWNKIFKKVEEDGGLTFENVLAVYRGLRDNYDYYLKYEESGKFFINEMMLRRIIGKGYGGEKFTRCLHSTVRAIHVQSYGLF
jgi:ribosomal protein L29